LKTPETRASILVVDDEPVIRDTLAEYLQQEGYGVTACGSGEEAVDLAGKQRFDVVLCDVNLPGLDGIEVLERIARVSPETFVILITAYATVETAVEAFQKGASDYLMKPVILREVLGKVRRLLKQRDLYRENQWLRRELNREAESGEMFVGTSPAMQAVLDLARKVAPAPSTVLLLGESGTGKELLARAIHRLAQAARPTAGRFLAVNCAAIPRDLLENQLFGHRKGAFTGADRDSPGVFAHAGAGTVFLDEIAELPLETQAKLLRVIEQKEIFPVGASEPVQVEARVLAATNKDLAREATEGRFREDLFFRLNVVSIRIPPLRERREDIPELVDFLLARHTRAMGKRITGVSHETMQLLLAHPWRGNIRELDNALQRAVILGEGPLVTPADLPPDIAPQPADPFGVDDLGTAVERFERLHIERMLRTCPDKREAARRLGIGLSSLYRKIEQYGITAPDRTA
jgi:DNA-binding NtrC family response regulator